MAQLTFTRMWGIGVNTWVWTSPPTDDGLAVLAPKVRAWGFDVIELPVEHPVTGIRTGRPSC